MADYTINITIAGKDQVSDDVQQVQRSIQSLSTTSQTGARNVRSFSQSQQEAGRATSGFEMALNYAKPAIAGFVAGFAIENVMRWTGELNQAGMEARATGRIFSELLNNSRGFTDSMEEMTQRLRQATRGIVDDTTLQQGANQLIQMGLAADEDEVERLLGMAVDLRRAGQDAGEAISDFSLLLANQSIQRLDNFGISSGRVRDRIEELLDAGQALNREEAFKMAVLEEGASAIDRLGTALDENATNWDRLRTHIENRVSDIAVFVSDRFEDMTGVVVDFLGLDQIQGDPGVRDAIAASMDERGVLEYNANIPMDSAQRIAQMEAEGSMLFESLLHQYRNNPVAFMDAASGMSDPALNKALEEVIGSRELLHARQEGTVADVIGGVFDPIASQREAAELARLQEEQAAAAERQAIALRTQQNIVNGANGIRQGFYDVGDALLLAGDRMAFINDRAEGFNQSYGDIIDLMSGTRIGMAGGMTIARRDDFNAVDQQVTDLERRYADMQRLAEESPGFVDEADLTMMERLVEQAQDYRDNLGQAADNFERMNLSQMLGQTSGGRLGELYDMILKDVEDEDVAENLRGAFDQRSGRVTDLSTFFEEVVSDTIAQIGQQVDADAAADAGQRAASALEAGLLAGLDEASIMEMVQQAIGYKLVEGGEGSGEFTVRPGDTASSLAAQEGVTVEVILTAANADSPYTLQPGTYNLPGSSNLVPYAGPAAYGPMYGPSPDASGYGGVTIPMLGEARGEEDYYDMALTRSEGVLTNMSAAAETDMTPLVSSFEGIEERADSIADKVAAISEMVIEPTFRPKLDLSHIPEALRELFGMVVSDNGGKVPGEDPRRRAVNGR